MPFFSKHNTQVLYIQKEFKEKAELLLSERICCLKKNLNVAFTLKTVLNSIQYNYLTLQGKETNFRRHRLTQTNIPKVGIEI